MRKHPDDLGQPQEITELAGLRIAATFVALQLEGFPDSLYEEDLWEQAQDSGLIVQRSEKHAPGECESCDDGADQCWVIAPGVREACDAALKSRGKL